MVKAYMRRKIWDASTNQLGVLEYDATEIEDAAEHLDQAGWRELWRLYREWVICK